MAITRAQQFRQMLEDGGMLVQPGFGGTRQGYRSERTQEQKEKDAERATQQQESYESAAFDPGPSSPPSVNRPSFPTGDDQDSDAIDMALAMQDQDFKGRRVLDGKTDLRTRPDKLADLKEKLRKFKATRNKVNIPGIGLSKGLQGIAQILSDFGAKFNRPYFERVIAAERIPGLDLTTIMDMTEEEIEDAYKSYMADRLAGKTDAMGNLKAGFMRDASGNIISTGNDGRDDAIIPVMAKAMEEEDTEEYVNPLSLLTPRIAGSRFLGSEFAADGGRIGFERGGRRGDYGQASYTESPSFSKPDDDSPQQTITKTKKPVRTFGDDSDAMRFDKRQLASFGIFGDPKKKQQLAKVYGTKDIEKLLGIVDEESAEKFVKDPIFGGAEFIDEKGRANIMEKFRENLLEQETKFPGKKFDAQRSAAQTLGISPTNRSLIPSDFLTEPGEAATQKPFEDIAADIAEQYGLAEGGTVNQNLPVLAAEGGIMDLGRQELFLGGIAKGLKKAARGVSRTLRKVAKSPIGKAAILGAIGFGIPGTSFGGIFGKGALSKFIGQKAMTQAPFAPGTGILGFIQKNPLLAIAGTSALAGALTPKEEDDQDEFLRQYYNMRLDPSLSVRGTGSEFDFYKPQFVADGGRIGAQEGGIMPRLNQLSGNVSSAEQMLQDINQRLQSAESSLGEGGMQQSVGQLQAVQAGGVKLNSLFAGRPVLGMQGQPAQISPVPIRGGGAMLRMMGQSGVAAAGYAEGGDVEPVAKKTMPLLDLKGQEMDLRAEGGFVPIGRMEKADDVPARLSKNEFVFTADAVRNAGDGDVDKGAEVMYNMMKNLERGGNVSDESQGLEGARRMFQTSKRLEEVL